MAQWKVWSEASGVARPAGLGLTWRRSAAAWGRLLGSGATLRRGWRGRSRHGLAGENRLEIVLRDRILVPLPEKVLLDEDIERRRIRVGVLSPEQANSPRVLLAAENQLLFLLALRDLLPDGHRDRHHDGHDAHGDEQSGHRIAALTSEQCFCLTP